MANTKVGTKTGKSTQAGRDVYKTEDGENVSEKSTTFKYKGQWINVPSIHNGYRYDDDTLRIMLDAEVIEPTSTHKNETDAVKAAVERSNNLKFNKGGTPMQRQMELFKDGGLKDEGGMIDEESGNEVPIGGTKKGVRDDIAANVSEGEFVMPADVVRYHGLDKMMEIRQSAKMGLKQMEAMGQMGNSDEATIPDDMPFGMADLIVVGSSDEPMEFADGGFVPSYAPGGTVQLTDNASKYEGYRNAPATSFQELMGDAYAEVVMYINAAGDMLAVPYINGSPVYPIPDGYTLYDPSATEPTGVQTEAVAALANVNAVIRNNDDRDRQPPPPPKPPINWQEISTDEFMSEAGKMVGIGRGVMSAVTMFMGPLSLLAKGLMTINDRSVAKEIEQRIKSGEFSAEQLETLNGISGKLAGGGGLLGKVVDTVGNLFGVSKAKKEAVVKVENAIVKVKQPINIMPKSGSIVVSQEFQDALDLPGELGDVQFTSTANMARDFAKDGTAFADTKDRQEKRYRDMLTYMATTGGPLPYGQTREGIESSIANSIGVDGLREIQSNVRPDFMQINSVGNLDDLGQIVTGSGNLGRLEEKKYGLSPPGSKLTSEESIAKRKNLASTYTPPSYDPVVRTPTPTPTALPVDPRLSVSSTGLPAAPVSTQTESAFGMPREDFGAGVPETRFTAPVAPAYEPLEDYVAPYSKEVKELKKLSEFAPRAWEKTRATIAGDSVSEYQAKKLGYSTEQPVIPPKTDAQIVAAARALMSQEANDRIDAGTNIVDEIGIPEYRKNYAIPTPPVAAAPVQYNPNLQNVDPVVQQTQQAFNAPAYIGQDSFSFQPPNVNTEITQAFPNPAGPEDRYAGYVPQTGTGSYDEVPNTLRRDTPSVGVPQTGTGSYDEVPNTLRRDTPSVGVPQTFKQAFAANRKAGAKEFSYDRDGDGKTERYTTKTVKEAAPKGSNTFLQSAKNLFTPGDGKEYVDGKIVTTGSSKSKTKTTPAASTNVSSANIVNTSSAPIAKANQSRYGDAGAGNVWAVQPGTNAVTKVKATKVSGSRSKEAVQAEINASYKANGGWTPAVDKLVKEREVAQPAPVVSNNNNDNDNDSGGGNDSTHCCTAAKKRGDMTLTEVKKLRAWHRSKDVFWQEGYDVWGKIVADHLVAKYKWSSDRVRDFYYHKIYGKLTMGSVCADIVIYPMSYAIGMYLHAVNKLTSIKIFKET